MTQEKTRITIRDFNLFYDIVKTLSKVSEGAKLSIGDCGLTVCSRNEYSKCELTSNSITTDKDISFCVRDLNMLFKILTTVKSLYENDFSAVNLWFDSPFLKVESKKYKIKLATFDEDAILDSIGKKVHTSLTPKLEFTTNSSMIKFVNSHSYIFNDSAETRVYLNTDSDMENNMIFARIGNDSNDLANSGNLELGMLNFGEIGDMKVILDFNRLNMLNIIQSDEIKVRVANEKPVLMTSIRKDGENGTFFNIDLYISLMVK